MNVYKKKKTQELQKDIKKVVKVTKDGRVLGKEIIEYVPEHLRNVISDYDPNATTNREHKVMQKRKVYHAPKSISRTILPTGEELKEVEEPIQLGDKQAKTYKITGLTQARCNTLIAAIRVGMKLSTACELAGIPVNTYHGWRKRAEEGKYPYTAFIAALQEARLSVERELLESLLRAATQRDSYVETTEYETVDENGQVVGYSKRTKQERVIPPQWKASAWLLERLNSDFCLSKKQEEKEDKGNTPEQDLLMMDGTSTGEAQDVSQSQ